jgi:adenosine/AMP kinase
MLLIMALAGGWGLGIIGCGSLVTTPTVSEISQWSFVDGNTANGINKDEAESVDHPQLTVFEAKLYAIWTENTNITDQIRADQIRVAVYNSNDSNPTWTFVDGNTTTGINKDTTQTARKPQLTVFNTKLYAAWKENNGTADQIRVVVYNSSDTSPTWTFVDGNTANGINKDHTKNADAPELTAFNGKLYAIWKENNGTAGQVRIAVYNNNDSSPSWSFVDGNSVNGINKDNTKEIYAPQLTVFSEKLYAIWKENNDTAGQIRVAVYNGDDTSPLWSLVDGNTASGLNKDQTKNAYYPQLTVFNEKLYAIWEESKTSDDTMNQIRVAVYNSDDVSPAWSFVDGNTDSGINKDQTKFADTPQLTVFNAKLYATWVERNSTVEQVRVAVYNSSDTSPSWSFIDGNTAYGINKDNTKSADSPQLTTFNEKLYAVWSENNGTAWQVRVACLTR